MKMKVMRTEEKKKPNSREIIREIKVPINDPNKSIHLRFILANYHSHEKISWRGFGVLGFWG